MKKWLAIVFILLSFLFGFIVSKHIYNKPPVVRTNTIYTPSFIHKNDTIKTIINDTIYFTNIDSSNLLKDTTDDSKYRHVELFDKFFICFFRDSVFQRSRISKSWISSSTFSKDTLQPANQWLPINIVKSLEWYVIVNDNFAQKIRTTNERVLTIRGIDTGILMIYYFKNVNGKWFLVQYCNYNM